MLARHQSVMMRITIVIILLISITLSSAQTLVAETEMDSIDQPLQAVSGEMPSQNRRVLDEMQKVSETENYVRLRIFTYVSLLMILDFFV
jgi:hypothetical protein